MIRKREEFNIIKPDKVCRKNQLGLVGRLGDYMDIR